MRYKRYYQNEPKSNGVYPRDNLPNNEYADAGTNWIVLYVLNNSAVYFDSLAIEHVPKGIRGFIGTLSVLVIFALDLLTICLQARFSLTILTCFCHTILKRIS